MCLSIVLLGVKVCGGFGGFGDVDVDVVPWEICAECRHLAKQEEDLTEVARMRLKPYQNSKCCLAYHKHNPVLKLTGPSYYKISN